MATSPNIGLDLPARGSNVGVWDTPVNGDFTIIDQAFGSVTTIAVSSTPVTLSTSQAQSAVIRFTGTLISNVPITLASVYKFWTIDNQITNSPSSFCLVMASTSLGVTIGLPPGVQDIFYDGTNIRYKNLGKLGEYWDYAGGAVPSWVSFSTVPPYLNCNGSAFSSATYPQLFNLLGAATLPDSRGRNRFTLNQGTGRLTTAGAGIDGNNNLSVGGNNGITLASSQIPTLTSSGTNAITVTTPNSRQAAILLSSAETASFAQTGSGGNVGPAGNLNGQWTGFTSMTGNNSIGVTYTNSSQAIVQATTPGYVGGITMIKAIP